jgi:hypothetical protein
MPLASGSSKEAIGQNIATERHAGKPEKQAIAIAYSEAGKSRKDTMGQVLKDCMALSDRFDKFMKSNSR